MSSALEAETGTLYYRCKRAIPYRVILQEMGHLQSKPTPFTNNNNIAHGLTMSTMTSKAFKSNDMRFQWLKCRKSRRFLEFLWARGPKNHANYPSKHHHGPHHLHVCLNYVVKKFSHNIELNSPQYICTYIKWHSTHQNVWPFFYFVLIFFSLSKIFNGLVIHIYLQGCVDLPT